VVAGNEMRVSDGERDAAAAELREHFASGRLDQDELDQRLTATFAARTRGDLSAPFTDLPSGPGGLGAGASDGQSRGGRPLGAGGVLGADGPFGPRGPFGPDGHFGPNGPFGPSGRFGPDGPFGPRAMNDRYGRGGAWRAGAGRALSRVIVGSILLWVLLIVGVLGVFGIGTGRPIGFVLIILAFGVLRRLLFSIFGRRRMGRGGRRGRR
jgi:hypothetical protein